MRLLPITLGLVGLSFFVPTSSGKAIILLVALILACCIPYEKPR